MKVLTAILTVYVFALTMAPCSDMHTVDSDGHIEVSLTDNQMHADHFEFCSPFCFCACCKTVSYPTISRDFKFPSMKVEFTFPTKDQRHSSFPETIWHPPKA